jgi:uncharacterized RDD family membrane protein YckC
MNVGPGPMDSCAPAAHPASITRRLACMLYEGTLLFGVVMVSGYLYSALTQQRHALQGTSGLQAFLFAVLGIYFVGFWSNGGQTLAMKTWNLRVVTLSGGAVSRPRALARYVLSWLWFVPALASVHYAGIKDGGAILAVVVAGVTCYVLLARMRADRQFLHDAACATRLIDLRSPIRVPAQSAA